VSDFPKHRPNVGVVLFHKDGRVWLGRRAKTEGLHSWQFPQGGVDEGEDFEAAALRELAEETGVTSVKVLGRTEGWITYDFPHYAQGSKVAKGWQGQKQVWFALRFTGKDKEVDLGAHPPPEFDAWRWGRLDEAPGLVIPFKRAAYGQVVEAFRQYAGTAMSGAILMIHGIGCTGAAWDRLAPAFRAKGWRVETPTLRPDKRTAGKPPADLPKIRLNDYVDDMEALARKLEAETGQPPVLMGHSMGGLIAQKLAERGVGRAAVLITPASPADCRSGASTAQAFTFANVLFAGSPETKSHKIWRTGFNWGVLNKVPKQRHAEIYAGAVYDSGGVYSDIAYPDRDPHKVATIDEAKVTVPVLTIGGAKDRATPIADVRRVGAKYAKVGGDYREYPDNAHWIIDEPGTDKVIGDIVAWLDTKGLTAEPPAPQEAPKPAAKAADKPKAVAPKAAKTPAKAEAAPKPAAKPKAAKVAAAKPAKTAAKPAPPKSVEPKAAKPKAEKPTAAKAAKPAVKAPATKPAAKAKAPAKKPAAKPPAKPKS
jgi:8-oxo-dGTP pyrophosphatase MutT (NUDIX family)/esterase/lipase